MSLADIGSEPNAEKGLNSLTYGQLPNFEVARERIEKRIEHERSYAYRCTKVPLEGIDILALEPLDTRAFNPNFVQSKRLRLDEDIRIMYIDYVNRVLSVENLKLEDLTTLEEVVKIATLVVWKGTSGHNPEEARHLLETSKRIDLDNPMPTKCNVFNLSALEIIDTIVRLKWGDDIADKIVLLEVGASFSPDLVSETYGYSATNVAHAQILLLSQHEGSTQFTLIDPYFSRRTPALWATSLSDLGSTDYTQLRAISGFMSALNFFVSPLHLSEHINNLIQEIREFGIRLDMIDDIIRYLYLTLESQLREIATDHLGSLNTFFNQSTYIDYSQHPEFIEYAIGSIEDKLRRDIGRPAYLQSLNEATEYLKSLQSAHKKE